MYNYQLSPINYQLSIINYQLSTVNYQLSIITYHLSQVHNCDACTAELDVFVSATNDIG